MVAVIPPAPVATAPVATAPDKPPRKVSKAADWHKSRVVAAYAAAS
ncbi:MAG: hypothetical protein WDO18_20535 [Acidobacteriota bacterium]